MRDTGDEKSTEHNKRNKISIILLYIYTIYNVICAIIFPPPKHIYLYTIIYKI